MRVRGVGLGVLLTPFAVQATPVLVAADGTAVGVVVDIRYEAGAVLGALDAFATVISEQGYAFDVELETGAVLPTVRLGPDVAGTLYEDGACAGFPVGPVAPGATFEVVGAFLYAPLDASPQMIAYEGTIQDAPFGGQFCDPSGGELTGAPILANDPTVTGMPDAPLPAPLQIEQRDGCLFSAEATPCDP